MIIGSVHWVVATVIAVILHLAGVLWLTVTSADRQLELESPGEGIVISVGRDARSQAESTETLEPMEDAAVASVAETRPSPPAAGTDSPLPEPADVSEPASAAPEPAGSVPDTRSAEVESVAPDTVESSSLDTAATMDPEPTQAVGAAEPESVEPEAVASREVAEVSPGQEPSVAVQTAASAPAEEPAEAPEAAAVTGTEAEVEQSESPTTVFADDAPVPESSSAPAAARQIRSPAAESPGVEISQVEPRADTAAAVENVETAPQERTAADPPVAPGSADESEVDVAAARQPAPEVERVFEPAAGEPTEPPETVDLQELQQSSGGTGVVASYAGVLKGWLQRNMHYPRAARLAGQEGDVVVRFVIDRGGNVQSVALESESGFPLLDREAREMVERGDPFPAMPSEMPGQRLEVRVPVSFHVRDENLTKEIPPIYLE